MKKIIVILLALNCFACASISRPVIIPVTENCKVGTQTLPNGTEYKITITTIIK